MTAADVIRMLLEMDQQVISPRPSWMGRAAEVVARLCHLAGRSVPSGLVGDFTSINLTSVQRRPFGDLTQPTMSLAEENDRLRAERDELLEIVSAIVCLQNLGNIAIYASAIEWGDLSGRMRAAIAKAKSNDQKENDDCEQADD